VHINAEQIWFQGAGKIIVGTEEVMSMAIQEDPEAVFENKLYINCGKSNLTDSSFAITPLYETGRNAIVATNDFKMIGKSVQPTYT